MGPTTSSDLRFGRADRVIVLDLIDQYLCSEAMSTQQVLPKSNIGIAAAYMRRHWTALTRFVDDASIPIDNNDPRRR